MMLDTGYWILDTGCWILDTGYWILDIGCWMLDIGEVHLMTNSPQLRYSSDEFFLDARCQKPDARSQVQDNA
jgi:hypothetical protein